MHVVTRSNATATVAYRSLPVFGYLQWQMLNRNEPGQSLAAGLSEDHPFRSVSSSCRVHPNQKT